MKLDPFQPILRPHGFLRPLHCLLFLLSLSLLNTFSPFDTSRSPPLSTPIRTNGSLFLTVRQPEANAKARERNASPPTRRSLPENGNNEGGEGTRGPLLIRFTRQEGGNSGAIEGWRGDCVTVSLLDPFFLSNRRRETIISLIIANGIPLEFLKSFVKSFGISPIGGNIVSMVVGWDRSRPQLFSSVRNDS